MQSPDDIFRSPELHEHHPLVEELSYLRRTVDQLQVEAYNSATKLQRCSSDVTWAEQRAAQLEHENATLKSELYVLRRTPHPDYASKAHPAVAQVEQLTLSLRRLSDKFSLTESALLKRTTQQVTATNDAVKAKLAAESAYELAARARGMVEEGKSRELALEMKLKAAEEAARMSDLVVQEYADLVRSLDAKSPGRHLNGNAHVDSPRTSVDRATTWSADALRNGLAEGKLGLKRLLSEFSTATEGLQAELLRVQGELAVSESKQDAERRNMDHHLLELANVQHQLDQLRLDDNGAAKMVSRYMKFSQQSTDTLQEALDSLKIRHKATSDSLYDQVATLTSQVQFYQTRFQEISPLFDDLAVEIMKEGHGLRREVALRLRMVAREEKIREALERWVRRAEEGLVRDPHHGEATLEKMVAEARTFLLDILGGISADSLGSIARSVVIQDTVNALATEFEQERIKRLEYQKAYAKSIGHPNALKDDLTEIQSDSQTTLGAATADEPTSSVTRPVEFQSPASSPSCTHTLEIASNDPCILNPIIDGAPVALKLQAVPLLPSDLSSHAATPGVDPKVPLDQAFLTASHQQSMESEPHLSEFSVKNHSVDEVVVPSKPDHPPLLKAESPHVPVHTSTHQIDAQNDSATKDQHHEDVRSDLRENAVAHDALSSASESSLPAHCIDTAQNASLRDMPQSPRPHPLLSDLEKAKTRYNDLQRGFRDCFSALQELKEGLLDLEDAETLSRTVRPEILRTAIQRLTDYTEDARVELEIRVADEELMARGYETLLSIPGALFDMTSSTKQEIAGVVSMDQSEVEFRVTAFVSGEDPSVQKAYRDFSRKLDDVEHDIAALKHAIHNVAEDAFISDHDRAIASGGGNGLLSWIRSPSTPNIAPGIRTPTFGNVMTNPHLRHSPSLSPGRRIFSDSGPPANRDPFAALGLKVSMPTYVHQQQSTLHATPQRGAGAVSAVYMLGLGAGSQSSPFRGSSTPLRKMGGSLRLDLANDKDLVVMNGAARAGDEDVE